MTSGAGAHIFIRIIQVFICRKRCEQRKARQGNIIDQDDRNITRKLAAIVSMDVKDYSRLMSDDDLETVKMLKSCRGLMTDEVAAHKGRVVDSPGDNLLSEFASVADAVQCAVRIQAALHKKNQDLPSHRKM